MKKLIIVLVSLAFVVCLVSCGNIRTYDDGFEDGYDEGYFDASIKYEDDYSKGISKAQTAIEIYLEDDMYHISSNIKDKYGIYPEVAIGILEEYLDDPDAISEAELHNAIYAIHRYYFDSYEVINNIGDYSID